MARAWELTEKEQEVCRLLADGMAPQDIARQLEIKPGSVYRHLVTIREKMECDHLVALVAKVCQGPGVSAWPVRRRRTEDRRQKAADRLRCFWNNNKSYRSNRHPGGSRWLDPE